MKEAISLRAQGGGQAAGGVVGEGNPRAIWRNNFTPIQVRAGRRLRRAALDVGIVDEPGKQAQISKSFERLSFRHLDLIVRETPRRVSDRAKAARTWTPWSPRAFARDGVKVLQKLLGHKTARRLTLDR